MHVRTVTKADTFSQIKIPGQIKTSIQVKSFAHAETSAQIKKFKQIRMFRKAANHSESKIFHAASISAVLPQILPYAFLLALTFFACWLFAARHGMFASSVDWISQHSSFPDYFRQQFYETGQFFPEFAPSLGGGQNIYNFSYYGLYSPVILISYLLPFVKMSDYLIAASLCCLAASAMLFYRWMKARAFSADICMTASVLFLLAGPMIYQSCRQIMFVNYMPFLCLAFLGIDRYIEGKGARLYIAGTFLMILTSFYFSIAGIFALLVYGASRIEKHSPRSFLRLILPVAAATLLAGALLVPTACSLLARSGNSASCSPASLFLPDLSVTRFAYSAYGIGLTAEIFAILLTGLAYRRKNDRLLSAVCLFIVTVPFFSWLLNGGLYAREKSLIPFLPLLCYLAAVWLSAQKRKEIPLSVNLTGHVAALAFCCLSVLTRSSAAGKALCGLLLIESLLAPLFFLLYKKYRLLPLLMAPSLICLSIYGQYQNGSNGKLLEKDFYEQVTDRAWNTEIENILNKETGLYRLEQDGTAEEKKANINRVFSTRQWISSVYSSAYQKDYQDFRTKSFRTDEPFRNILMQPASENPLFRKLMGVKYLVKRSETSGRLSVNTQDFAAPVIYATDKIISETQYRALSFPDSQTALMRQAVAQEPSAPQHSLATANHSESSFPSASIDLPAVRKIEAAFAKGNGIVAKDGRWRVRSKKSMTTQLRVRQKAPAGEQLLYMQFDVENHKKNKDVAIDLAGIRNKLSADYIYYNENVTFTYVIPLAEGQTEIPACFTAGDYEISNLQAFLGDASLLKDDALYQSEFAPDREKTKGNRISGEIHVKRAGCLITSIPYDKGFELLVDGAPVKTQKVNTAFLGAVIPQGRHQIDILYHAPGLAAGKLLSCAGFFLWLAIELYHKKKLPKKREI